MIETFRRTIPATPEQIFVLVNKNAALKKKCPAVRYEQSSKPNSLDVLADTGQLAQNGENQILKIFKENLIEFFPQTLTEDQIKVHPKHVELKRNAEFILLYRRDIELQLANLQKLGLVGAHTGIQRIFNATPNMCAVISDEMDEVKPVFQELFAVKAELKSQAPAEPKTLMEADPVKTEYRNINKKMIPNRSDYELDLKLSNKDLYVAYLYDLVTKFDEREHIIIFDRFDRLNIRGDKDACDKIKGELRRELDGLCLQLIDTKHLTDLNQLVRDLPKDWGVKYFTKQAALQKCDQLIAQYYICQPKLILEEISATSEVATFIIPVKFKKNFLRHVRKYNKHQTVISHGPDAKPGSSEDPFFSVAKREFDECQKDFREYLRDMKLGPKDFAIHHHQDKTTIRVGQKYAKVVEDYIHNSQCVLFIKAECDVAQRFISDKQPVYRTAVLQSGITYTKYTEAELFKEYMKKQEVKEDIAAGRTQQTSEKCNQAFYMEVKGIRNVVNAVIDDFEHYRKNALLSNQQEWVVELPAYLQNNYITVERLLSSHLEAESKVFEQDVRLQRTKKKGFVYIATFLSDNNKVIERFKDNFTGYIRRCLNKTTIPGFDSLRDVHTIAELKNMDNIIEHEGEVIAVSFENIGDVLSSITKIVDRAKKTEEVQIDSSTWAIIRNKVENYPKNDHIKQKIRQTKDGVTIEMDGLPHRIKPVLEKLKQDIHEAEGGMKTDSFEIDREQYLILKNRSPLVTQLKKELDIKIEVEEKKHDKAALIRLANFNKLQLVAEEMDSFEDEKVKVYTNIGDISNPEFKKAAGSQKCCYFKELNSVYLDLKEHPTIKSQLAADYPKKKGILMTIPQTMQLNAVIADILSYLQSNPDQPSVTLCARATNPSELNSLEKRVDWIHRDKSLKSLNISNEKWHFEETPGFFKEYSDQALKFFSGGNKQKLIASSYDLGITEKNSPVYIDKPKMVVYLPQGEMVRLVNNRNSYEFSHKNATLQFSQELFATIEGSKTCDVACCWYEIDFSQRVQRNLLTGSERRIELRKGADGYDVKISNGSTTYRVKICTEKSRIEKLKKNVQERIDKALKNELKHEVSIKYPNKIISRKLFERLCEEGCLSACPGEKICQDGINVEVKVKGYEDKDLQQLKNQVQLMTNRMGATNWSVPKHWLPNKTEIDEIVVDKNSEQFKQIQNSFKIAPIIKLTRIQNTFLWKKYCQERQNQFELTTIQPKQLMLFHGTKQNDPQKIYQDKEESFKINYAADTNMFGRGIYFAKEASYSDNGYAYQTINATKKMLYCKVNVGECQVMQQHEGRPDMKDTDIRDRQRNIRYGCRMSNYHGSDIYIIYSTGRAYPEYLIEYSNTVYGGGFNLGRYQQPQPQPQQPTRRGFGFTS